MKRGLLRAYLDLNKGHPEVEKDADKKRKPSRIEERIRLRRQLRLNNNSKSAKPTDSVIKPLNSIAFVGENVDDSFSRKSNSTSGTSCSGSSSSENAIAKIRGSKQRVDLLELGSSRKPLINRSNKCKGMAKIHFKEKINSLLIGNGRPRTRAKSAPCTPLFQLKYAKSNFVNYKIVEKDCIDGVGEGEAPVDDQPIGNPLLISVMKESLDKLQAGLKSSKSHQGMSERRDDSSSPESSILNLENGSKNEIKKEEEPEVVSTPPAYRSPEIRSDEFADCESELERPQECLVADLCIPIDAKACEKPQVLKCRRYRWDTSMERRRNENLQGPLHRVGDNCCPHRPKILSDSHGCRKPSIICCGNSIRDFSNRSTRAVSKNCEAKKSTDPETCSKSVDRQTSENCDSRSRPRCLDQDHRRSCSFCRDVPKARGSIFGSDRKSEVDESLRTLQISANFDTSRTCNLNAPKFCRKISSRNCFRAGSRSKSTPRRVTFCLPSLIPEEGNCSDAEMDKTMVNNPPCVLSCDCNNLKHRAPGPSESSEANTRRRLNPEEKTGGESPKKLYCCRHKATRSPRVHFCREIITKHQAILRGDEVQPRGSESKTSLTSDKDWAVDPEDENKILNSLDAISFPKETRRAMNVLMQSRDTATTIHPGHQTRRHHQHLKEAKGSNKPDLGIFGTAGEKAMHVATYAQALAVFQRTCDPLAGGRCERKLHILRKGSDGGN